jgi:glycogen operon protein
MRKHPVLRRRRFFQGHVLRGENVKDIMWLAPSGQEMSEGEWNADHVKCLGVRLAGDAIGEVDMEGVPIRGETLLYLLNASGSDISFTLPSFAGRPTWETALDTFDVRRVGEIREGGATYPLVAHSLALLRRCGSGGDEPA